MNRIPALLTSLLALCGGGLAWVGAQPATAAVTVVGNYTFLNGDTATRSSYYSMRRVRVTTPDGREIVFDSKSRRIMLIDHARRVFWNGPLARADSIVDVVDGTRWALLLQHASDQQKAEWERDMATPSESVYVEDAFKTKRIAGYPCNREIVHAGPFLHLERWIARSLVIEHYDPETEDLVLAAVIDPVGRAVMRMYWESREGPGLPLGATMTLDTPSQRSTFTWEAQKVIEGSIPDSVWKAPSGYAAAQL